MMMHDLVILALLVGIVYLCFTLHCIGDLLTLSGAYFGEGLYIMFSSCLISIMSALVFVVHAFDLKSKEAKG